MDGRSRRPLQEMVNTMDAERRGRQLQGMGSGLALVAWLHDVQRVICYSVDSQEESRNRSASCPAKILAQKLHTM